MYKLMNRPVLRTICFQASGTLTEQEALQMEREAHPIVGSYEGRPHLFFADGRGLRPASPAVAEIMQRLITYCRQRGTVCCVHLHDIAITQLQAARLARQATRNIDGTLTIEVASLEEAELVLREQRKLLWDRCA